MDGWIAVLPQVWIVLTGLGLLTLGVVVHRDLDQRALDAKSSEPSSLRDQPVARQGQDDTRAAS